MKQYLDFCLLLHEVPDLLLSEGGREISNEDTASLSAQTVLLHVPNLTTLPADLGAPHPALL